MPCGSPPDQEVTQEPWQTFERTFSNGTTKVRYMAEVIYGHRRRQHYWLLTTEPDTLPANSTSFVMVCAPDIHRADIGKANQRYAGLGRLSHDRV